MEINLHRSVKKNPLLIYFILLFFAINYFFAPVSLSAQDANLPSGYYVVTQNGESRFIQRFTWHGGEYAIRYEVIIDIFLNGRYIQHLREETTLLYVEVSLPPGRYRFQVIPYDFFERQGAPSEWKYVEVLYALKPEPKEALPEIIRGESGEDLGFIFTVTGNNLDPDAEFILHHPDKTQSTLETVDVDKNGDLKVFVDVSNLETGEYDVFIRNPGGLEARVGRAAVLNKRDRLTDHNEQLTEDNIQITEDNVQITQDRLPLEDEQLSDDESQLTEDTKTEKAGRLIPLKNFIPKVGLSLMPIVSLYGYDDYDNNYYNDNGSILGIALHLSGAVKITSFYIGLELFGSVSSQSSINTGINLLAEKWFAKDVLALSLRGGVSIDPFQDRENVSEWDNDSQQYITSTLPYNITMNLGVSFSLRITNNMLLDLRLNYSNVFSDPSKGYLNPWFGMILLY